MKDNEIKMNSYLDKVMSNYLASRNTLNMVESNAPKPIKHDMRSSRQRRGLAHNYT